MIKWSNIPKTAEPNLRGFLLFAQVAGAGFESTRLRPQDFILPGPQGLVGPQGTAGSALLRGATGPAGVAGVDGVPGAAGAAGAAGARGAEGSAGPADTHATLVSTGFTFDFDFAAARFNSLRFAANAFTRTFSTSNRAAGRWKIIRCTIQTVNGPEGDAIQGAPFIFPAAWRWATAIPPQIRNQALYVSGGTNRVCLLSLFCYGSADADIVAAWSETP